MSDYDFKAALKAWNDIQEPIEHSLECRIEDICNNVPVSEMKKAIKEALRIADRLQGEGDLKKIQQKLDQANESARDIKGSVGFLIDQIIDIEVDLTKYKDGRKV